MILIADSGSTKTDWIALDGNNPPAEYSSMGFNPVFHSEQTIETELRKNAGLLAIAAGVKTIHFFGAGCSSQDRNLIVKNALAKIFTNASINVDHDMMASVLATCGSEAGIVCILGTGSNACVFDGKKVLPNNYGLGFILADEGAGTSFGKMVITSYLYNTMPAALRKSFEAEHALTKEMALSNVYGNSSANTWLASFASFAIKEKSNPWMRNKLKEGLEVFVNTYITTQAGFSKLKVHFIGSMAFLNSDILHEIAKERNFKIGKVIQKPIMELAKYFGSN